MEVIKKIYIIQLLFNDLHLLGGTKIAMSYVLSEWVLTRSPCGEKTVP